ncbi:MULTISPECIES: hypothetical protein [Enterococcus]|uniref:hypothetical protein n=1 Tax=Enterococcus TaxID=1350 RepID=UPI000B70872A|nr:GTP cyclohydrolase II [Enterococcus sp. 3H8_DIV0648]
MHLRLEGRGIGLKKLWAYQLQEHARDTYDANVELGFAPDERDYSFAAEMPRSLGITQIRLLTNNPDKVTELRKHGNEVVEQIALETQPLKENIVYLKTKRDKFQHCLSKI